MKVVAIILTLNEQKHIARCIQSVSAVADEIVVVDSYSTDRTVVVAEELGVKVLQRKFKNHADQFNWAVEQVENDADWLIRIDADEYFDADLLRELRGTMASAPSGCDGLVVNRKIIFQGDKVRFGGVFPVEILRFFRARKGRCEARWMDEHIKVEGTSTKVAGEIVDDNLNPLTWWVEKHNSYASREAVDILNKKYGFFPVDSVAAARGGGQAGVKRWLKESVYQRLPAGLRAGVYFAYRFILRLGFLDTAGGRQFHILQGFWYRYLVDCKVTEVERHIQSNNCSAASAVHAVLGIQV